MMASILAEIHIAKLDGEIGIQVNGVGVIKHSMKKNGERRVINVR